MSLYNASSFFFLLLFLLLPSFEASITVVGPGRSVLRALPDIAVQLNSSNFDTYLKESPATFAVVEFSAHWSPACRNYKPHYEKVAMLFNSPDAVHPGIIVMTWVDCALKMNTNLCDRFSVGHYPMLLWGHASTFASGRWAPKQEKNEIKAIDDARTADRLLAWINKEIGSSFNLEDEKYENESALPQNVSDPEQIARAVYDVEEAITKAFNIIFERNGFFLTKPSEKGLTNSQLQDLMPNLQDHILQGAEEILELSFDLYLWHVTIYVVIWECRVGSFPSFDIVINVTSMLPML